MAFSQAAAVVRQFTPAVKKSVAQRLVDGDRSSWRVQVQWPGGRKRWFWRIVDTKCDAERALFAVGVSLEPRARLVGGHVHVRWLDGFAHQDADDLGELQVEKARCRFVVGEVSARTLIIA